MTFLTNLGIFLGIFIFIVAFGLGYMFFGTTVHGTCVSDALSEITEIRTAIRGLETKTPGELSDPIPVSLGNCAGSMLFINREDLLSSNIQVPGSLECITNYDGVPYQGFMVFVPNPGIDDTGWRFWERWKELPRAELKDFLNEYRLIEKLCKPLFSTDDMFDYSNNPITLDGPGGSGTKEYCIQVKKTGSHIYDIITLHEGVCA
ncbi:MAG: hypothetical protein ACYSR0_12935 [Planctomycetota bacterium]|jgi:hypothetical protein